MGEDVIEKLVMRFYPCQQSLGKINLRHADILDKNFIGLYKQEQNTTAEELHGGDDDDNDDDNDDDDDDSDDTDY